MLRRTRAMLHCSARLLALAALPLVAPCGPSTTDARRLWLDSPQDGTLALLDHEPPPY